MIKFNSDLEKEIINYIKKFPESSSKEIYDGLNNIVAYATIKRAIKILLSTNLIATIGNGKATKYTINKGFEIVYPINLETYFEKEIDEREIKEAFNLELIKTILSDVSIFTDNEIVKLSNLQIQFSENISKLSIAEFNREFERLAIDLSWKSSQIEGNTYSLLETERLLKEQETAAG